MRLNQYIAQATGLSRRAADRAIANGQVKVNGITANVGTTLSQDDLVTLDNKPLKPSEVITILFNKPSGFVCSRNGQGSSTIYDLLPNNLRNLKPVGRLDKDSSGLILLTNNGQLANELTHPKYQKVKAYEVVLDKELNANDQQQIEKGISLADGLSSLKLTGKGKNWQVEMSEGRNRQIRRTFEARGYSVVRLHRTKFGNYALDDVKLGSWIFV